MSRTNETGVCNPYRDWESMGLAEPASVAWNLSEAALVETAVRRGEGSLTAAGALAVTTGVHTGRSAADKHIVRDAGTQDEIWWENNRAMPREAFERLYADFKHHVAGRALFVQDLVGGADPRSAIRTRVVCEFAWHALFIRNLLIRPSLEDVRRFEAELTIIDLPSFRADPERHGCRTETVIACDLTRRIVLIGGTSYAGEMKKAVFTVLNHLLPEKGVLPMHASANVGAGGDTTVFFGLSGTGKTTLSADPSRTLVGDDEHGWGADGVFNFEGGCYAKTIRLSRQAEPAIFAATHRFGTVLENVVLGPDRAPDLDDASLTENTRAAYPIEAIANASPTGRAPQPKTVVMLTADAFGVMPPIARLDPEEAMVHFLSGYTAKIAGTEKGVTEPQATFSACFGAPFMPRPPAVYGGLFKALVARHGVRCWLVNTGWTGGSYGTGTRMPIAATRALLAAALDGTLDGAEFRRDPTFGFAVPVAVPGVDPALLDPRSTWADGAAYDRQAAKLLAMFRENFAKFEPTDESDVPFAVAAE